MRPRERPRRPVGRRRGGGAPFSRARVVGLACLHAFVLSACGPDGGGRAGADSGRAARLAGADAGATRGAAARATAPEASTASPAVPAPVRAACDSAAAAARRGLAGARAGAVVRQVADTLARMHALDADRHACAVVVDGHLSASDAQPWQAFAAGLPGGGWMQDNRFLADGPGGTGYAVRTSGVVCEVDGSWDDPGVMDEEEEKSYVPSDAFGVYVRCSADDSPLPPPADSTAG